VCCWGGGGDKYMGNDCWPSLRCDVMCSLQTDLHCSTVQHLELLPREGRLRWSRGSVLAFGTQIRGFKPGRSRRIFKGEKIFRTPSFGGEVKPSVPCRRFAACKRSLELSGIWILSQICRNISRPRRVSPSAARGLSRLWTWRHLAEKVGTSKGGGKKWQPTPKNLPRIQRARAIPVAWLGSGFCYTGPSAEY